MAARRRRLRLPLVVYIHGGSFCTESAFGRTYHRYATSLAGSAGALVVSVEYRLAPEHPIPTAYDDTWSALQWVASLADPWLADYADPSRSFLAGDSAGGNIAYHTAVRAARNNSIHVEGVIIVQPYFWGPDRLPSEAVWDGTTLLPATGVDKLWPFVTAGRAGNDDARINPPDEEIASLARRRVLLAVAEKDTLRDRGVLLSARIRDCARTTGGVGDVTLVESEGEDHGFHLYSPLRATSRKLMDSIVSFINQPPPELMTNSRAFFHVGAWEQWGELEGNNKLTKTPAAAAATAGAPQPLILGVPSRPYSDIFGYGTDMKQHKKTVASAYAATATSASSKTGPGNTYNKQPKYGLFNCPLMRRPNKPYRQGAAAAALLPIGTQVINNFF